MTRDEIKQLALKSGFPLRYQPGSNDLKPYVYDFAQKIESATSERMRMDGWRQCAKCQHTSHFCGQFEEAVAKAVLAEREACRGDKTSAESVDMAIGAISIGKELEKSK